MIRRTALLSALTVTLLLTACSQHKEDAADDAQAQAASEAQDAGDGQVAMAADEAPPPPPPRLNYWPVFGPLIAGSYGSECTGMPDMRKANGSVAVGADGKVAASGVDIDFREAGRITLIHNRVAKDDYRGQLALFMNPDEDGMLNVLYGGGEPGGATVVRNGKGVTCGPVAGVSKLNTQPPFQALSGLVNQKKQTLACMDAGNPALRHDVDVDISNGIIRVGDASFDTRDASHQIVQIEKAGESMALSLSSPDKWSIVLAYEGNGNLTDFSGRVEPGTMYACSKKQ